LFKGLTPLFEFKNVFLWPLRKKNDQGAFTVIMTDFQVFIFFEKIMGDMPYNSNRFDFIENLHQMIVLFDVSQVGRSFSLPALISFAGWLVALGACRNPRVHNMRIKKKARPLMHGPAIAPRLYC
jgi:hypothetical protein